MKNKRFLIDTQIFIWWMGKSKRISDEIFELLNNPMHQIFLSTGSIWEIVLKKSKKKLKTPKNIAVGVQASGFTVLPIELKHVLGIEKLPSIHKDPFDRLFISQARAENLTLITSDTKIWKYRLSLLKA